MKLLRIKISIMKILLHDESITLPSPYPSIAKCNARKYVRMLNELSTTAYYQFSKLVVTSRPTDIYPPVRIQFTIYRIHILVKFRACGLGAENSIFSCDEKSLRSNVFIFLLEIIVISETASRNFRRWIRSMGSQFFDVKLDGWANVL